MINEQDLPTLIKLQELLNERDDSTPVTFIDFLAIKGSLMSEGEKGNLKNTDKDFEVLSEILIEHGIAEPFDGGGITMQLLKTNKTHKIKIEDIFKQEQQVKAKDNLEHKNIEYNFKSSKWYHWKNILLFLTSVVAFLAYFYPQKDASSGFVSTEVFQKAIDSLTQENKAINNRLNKIEQHDTSYQKHYETTK